MGTKQVSRVRQALKEEQGQWKRNREMKGDLGQRWVVAEDSVGSGGMLGCRMGRGVLEPHEETGKGVGT